MHKVFVYGSLLSGMGNHGLLVGSKLLGISKSPGCFDMIDLGWFPGVFVSEYPNHSVVGEVYEVDDTTFAQLDRLEGYNATNPDKGLYNRMKIDTSFGEAFIYVYNRVHEGHLSRLVGNGDWKTYCNNRRR